MTRQASTPPPAVAQGRGVRIEEAGIGAVSIAGIDPAGFDAAYPWGWASLEGFDPALVAEASHGALDAAAATSVKVLLACAVVREFVEPARGERAPAAQLFIPLAGDALTFLHAGATRPLDDGAAAAVLATMFGKPVVIARRIVDSERQKAER